MLDPDLARTVCDRLSRAGCVAAEDEAAALIAASPDSATVQAWVARREQGEPLAWITGRVEFLGQTMLIEPGVYVPRANSEPLAARAAELLPEHGRAADLCTGSGAVARHVMSARPAALVIGTDLDPRAVACARRNGVPAAVADLDLGLASRAFDVVTAVTPFVPTGEMRLLPSDVLRYEPRIALDGGPDGLDVVRRVIVAAARLLRRDGWLVTQLGSDQDLAVADVLEAEGFCAVTFWRDDEGDLRGLAARLP